MKTGDAESVMTSNLAMNPDGKDDQVMATNGEMLDGNKGDEHDLIFKIEYDWLNKSWNLYKILCKETFLK